jgi:hypothetical protein
MHRLLQCFFLPIKQCTVHDWGQVYFFADLVCLWQRRDKSGMLLGSWHPVFLFCDKHSTARQRVNNGRQETAGLAVPCRYCYNPELQLDCELLEKWTENGSKSA